MKPSELRGLLRGPDNGMPKYLRLRNALAAAINEGRWKPGTRIPTEDLLTESTGMSLGTVQKALRALVDDGMVVRHQGTGSFVADVERPMHAPFYHCRFVDEEGRLLPIFSKFVQRGEVRTEGPWSAHLPGDSLMCIERVFSINHEFSVYTHLYFDAHRLPALAKASPTKLSGANLKDLIAHEQHVPLVRFSEALSVRVFPVNVCVSIGVKPKTSGAVLEILAFDRKGETVYFQDLFIAPNARRLVIST